MNVSVSDEQLLEQSKLWDSQAFEALYLRWKKPLYVYLLHLLSYQKDDAEQVLSDVFLSLYEYNMKYAILACKSFLYSTAHNKALDLIKKKSEVYAEQVDHIVDEYDVSFKKRFSASYEQWILAKYLAALPDKEREIVYLYYHEDKSYEEIATIVDSNKNTVWTLLSQAKKKIYALAEREGTLDLFH